MSRFVFARHMTGIVSVASVEFGKGEGFRVSVRCDMKQMTFDQKEIYPFQTDLSWETIFLSKWLSLHSGANPHFFLKGRFS